VLNAFGLAFGGLLLLGGRLGDMIGQLRAFRTGIVLFVVASLLGGLAGTPAVLVTARVLQGIGAALAGPSVLALVMAMARDAKEQARGMSLFIAVSSIGASAGLMLGGVLTEFVSWRASVRACCWQSAACWSPSACSALRGWANTRACRQRSSAARRSPVLAITPPAKPRWLLTAAPGRAPWGGITVNTVQPGAINTEVNPETGDMAPMGKQMTRAGAVWPAGRDCGGGGVFGGAGCCLYYGDDAECGGWGGLVTVRSFDRSASG
jgi:MFS family permease